MADRVVDVHLVLGKEELLAGRLWSHRRRGRESASFAYDAGYLAHPRAYALEPALPLVAGQQQTAGERAMFAAFSDCAPDRWGRRLIQRDEEHRAGREGTAERSFGEIDYLLGVRDDLRQGALRFVDPDRGTYLSQADRGIPHLLELGELLGAADRLERDTATESELQLLLHGGSSLGGARPKAHVLDGDGRIAIAKFPSPSSDDWDVMRWEAVALRLARQAGIRVPDSQLHVIDGKPVLVVDRFDRAGDQRIGYASAMTLLEAGDGDRASYLDIAAVIETESPRATEDLHELWRRIAFSVLIRNTDDHLRNHGFLRVTTAGWTLSPAFDLNPDPRPGPKLLSTAIDYDTREARIDTVLAVSALFRLDGEAAVNVLSEVVRAVGEWRRIATDAGLDGAAIEQMARAFEHDADRASPRARGGRSRTEAEPQPDRRRRATLREGERRDSNPRPPGPQPGALPTELRPPRDPESSSGERPCDHPSMSFELGDRVPAFTLDDTEGTAHAVPADPAPPATVLVVTCNHCPYVIAWNPRLRAVAEDYAPRDVRFLAINANDANRYPADSPEAMKRFVSDQTWPIPYLYDESQDVARALDAQVTPHVFVLDADQRLRYRGAPDADHGDRAQDARYLRDALDAVLAGDEPRPRRHPRARLLGQVEGLTALSP